MLVKSIFFSLLLLFSFQVNAQIDSSLNKEEKTAANKTKESKGKAENVKEEKNKPEKEEPKAPKQKPQEVIEERDKYKNDFQILEKKYKDLNEKFKKDSDSKLREIESLTNAVKLKDERIIDLINDKTFLSRPQTTIFNQTWSANYLSEDDVKILVPGIKEIKDLSTWNEACLKNEPAYMYHQNDKKREYGVLLNVTAVRSVKAYLNKAMLNWKIPETSDIEILKVNLQKFKNSHTFLDILTSSRTDSPNWKKKGGDLYGWDMPPLSFMRNEANNWYTSSTTASFLYIDKDADIQKSISIFEMDESEPNYIFMLEKDIMKETPNYAVYVRLIKKTR